MSERERERLKVILKALLRASNDNPGMFDISNINFQPERAYDYMVNSIIAMIPKLDLCGMLPKSDHDYTEEAINALTQILPHFHAHPTLELELKVPEDHVIIDRGIFADLLQFISLFRERLDIKGGQKNAEN